MAAISIIFFSRTIGLWFWLDLPPIEAELILFSSLFRKKQKISQFPQPLRFIDLIEAFDVFYICFDEPNRNQNWKQISNILPQAKKIEGVVGFDNALKACAQSARSDYFFVIDGDNQLLPERFRNEVVIPDLQDDWVLSWSSFNPLNALAYGNGGVKLWPQKVAETIRSHEQAAHGDDPTDYCFVADYYLVDDYLSQTIMNGTVQQAFRAGFREGVKMSLAWGKQVELNHQTFEKVLGKQNRQRLKIWCEIGDDSLHGCWAILGARLGLIKNAFDCFDYQLINSYDWIDQCLEMEVLQSLELSIIDINNFSWDKKKVMAMIELLGEDINHQLPLDLKLYSPIESHNFKQNFKNPPRQGLLSP